ncbi:hypothetical protein PTSG_07582 [Salpingoeca rosetta]|uniref:OTU domain-containing protein n=1 Tax=Salpingoeca rosetta (strain ATCC 50818 / BSB-021) TaxID=946362 RepID=F2UH66_SALR5|nr:uncharacterized protein PTSG_07582 [Salpingoeca rosetta]EGD76465.1 hypothetical protein PTSG_07582 [Salpingoeca rosetta]|eukprot:XP_004991380.1 hypothetical protein PTSG_07582 [Salpingoeca rosetta]
MDGWKDASEWVGIAAVLVVPYGFCADYGKSINAVDEYLEAQGRRRKDVAGDGACLFRCFSFALFHTEHLHMRMRRVALDHMRQHRHDFEPFMEKAWDQYMLEMSGPKVWGTQLELQALAAACNLAVVIFAAQPTPHVSHAGSATGVIELCYWNNNHYDIVYPISFFDTAETIYSVMRDIVQRVTGLPPSAPRPFYRAEPNLAVPGGHKLAVGSACAVRLKESASRLTRATITRINAAHATVQLENGDEHDVNLHDLVRIEKDLAAGVRVYKKKNKSNGAMGKKGNSNTNNHDEDDDDDDDDLARKYSAAPSPSHRARVAAAAEQPCEASGGGGGDGGRRTVIGGHGEDGRNNIDSGGDVGDGNDGEALVGKEKKQKVGKKKKKKKQKQVLLKL